MKESVSVKQDYVMIMHNPVEDVYTYHVYHIIDISIINNETIVNIQSKDENKNLKRFSMTDRKFYDLISSGFLTRLQE